MSLAREREISLFHSFPDRFEERPSPPNLSLQ